MSTITKGPEVASVDWALVRIRAADLPRGLRASARSYPACEARGAGGRRQQLRLPGHGARPPRPGRPCPDAGSRDEGLDRTTGDAGWWGAPTLPLMKRKRKTARGGP
jgi:hypothetical protein